VAGAQTAGVGRHGHTWHSAESLGLYFSVTLPLSPLLTLALGIASAEAIQNVTLIECDLRWPNDLLLQERKLAGILVQSAGSHAVAGIGINVGQRSFPPDIRNIATSLAIETGLDFRREDIFVQLVKAMDRWLPATPDGIRSEFSRRSSYVHGKRVSVSLNDREITGVTAGLTPEGYLEVLSDTGRREVIVAGGVRPAAGRGAHLQ
jgi:BirA family biotin operon repressor/biotin-[acetyl-CoA-carboxylase] ligase